MKQPDAPEAPDPWRPVSGRQRLVILLLAVATAAGVVLALTGRPGGADAARPAPHSDGPPRCTASQQTGCVGGQTGVIMLPAAGASTAR